MSQFKYKTRGNSNPKGKPRVYFCCHPEDFKRYFESVSNEILAKQNCAVWYTNEAITRDEDFFLDLKQMQLFVMPVTTNLLCTENEALDIEFNFAIENHIPVLPLMQESGLEELFNKKCGDLQFLDKNNADITAISYDEKLQKYLESVLIGDELAEKIRAAFDAYVFLSYRKKDRKHAQELMRLIHKNEFYRDIAIWYDEFLTPGENFNNSIKEALQKSGLFVLTVTPNLVNETNYIMTTEYPMAKEEGKPILPAELVPTNREELSKKYAEIPNPTNAYNEAELSEALLESIKKMAIKENENSPEHNFFIGLAYLGGVDVEVDRERALELITGAAEAGLIEATDELYNMYLNGHGVKKDYEIATKWFHKKMDLLKERVHDNGCAQNYINLISGMRLLAQHYSVVLGNHLEAKKIYFDTVEICNEAYQKFKTLQFKRNLGLSCVKLAQSYMTEGEYDLATEKITEASELYKGINEEQLRDITDNLKTATIGQLLDYYISHNDIAVLYEGLAEIAQKNKQFEKAEEYLLKCLEFRIKTRDFFKDQMIPEINITASYLALATHYFLVGNLKKALEYYEMGYPLALEMARQTGNLYSGEISIRLHMLRAQIHITQNELEKAAQCYITNLAYLEASELSPQLIELKAINCYHASKQFYALKNFKNAEVYLNSYLYICREAFGEEKYVELFNGELDYLTDCNMKAGNHEKAIGIHTELLKHKHSLYLQKKDNMSAIIYSLELIKIGDLYLQCDDYNRAKHYYNTTLEFAESLRTSETTSVILQKVYIKMAMMYTMMNNKRKTKKCYKHAIKIAKKSVKQLRTQEAYRRLFEIYGKMGDWYKSENQHKSALKCYLDAIYLAEESLAVYQEKEDKSYLASLYLTAGTLPVKNNDSMLRKSLKLWQSLLKTDPTSQSYQYGYNIVCQALNIVNNSCPKDSMENNIMTLTDENGNEETYELLDLIVENNIEYGVFMPLNDSEKEVLILRVYESNEEENRTSYSVIDDELAEKIFEIFKRRNKDKIDFFE